MEFVKINMDGSFSPNSRTGACGGIIQDSNSKVLSCFSKRLGYCNVILAELWSLKYGIKFALFEMDAREVVHMIDGIKSVPSSLRPLVEDIRRMLWANGWQNSIVHINREANSIATWATKFGHQRDWSSFLVDDVRRAIASLLRLP